MKLVIDRTRWLQGEGYYKSFLLRKEDNKMCCLGFYCKQLGISDEAILNISNLYEIFSDDKKLIPSWCFGPVLDSLEIKKLVKTNDDINLSKENREKEIIANFASHDVNVEFIGNYP